VATAKVSDSNKHPSLLKNKINYDHKQVYSRDPRGQNNQQIYELTMALGSRYLKSVDET
jgi:hypothetical protein